MRPGRVGVLEEGGQRSAKLQPTFVSLSERIWISDLFRCEENLFFAVTVRPDGPGRETVFEE